MSNDKQSYFMAADELDESEILETFWLESPSTQRRSDMAATPPAVISALEVVGSPLCIASEDGQKLFLRLAASLKEGRPVILSFKNVSSLTSAFLNAAIGPLYGKFGESEIRKNLSVTDMDPNDRTRLKRVVETTKAYFNDPVRLKRTARESIG